MAASFVNSTVVSKVPRTDANGMAEPASISIPVTVTPAAGNWLYCLIAWRQIAGAPVVTWQVSDDAHNWWDPLGAPNITSDEQGLVRTTIWRCPAARIWPQPNAAVSGALPGVLLIAAPTGMYASASVCVLEFTGMLAGVSDLPAATVIKAAGTTLNLGTPAPGAEVVALACAAASDHTTTLSASGGWTTATASASNPSDTQADLAALFAWQVTSAEADLTVTSTNSAALAASACGSYDAVAPPAQPQPSWPFFALETVPGAGQTIPADKLRWARVPAAWLDLKNFRQGRQYELSSLSTGAGGLTIDNPNGELLPPGSQIISGTPVRLRACWQGGQWQARFHGDGATFRPLLTRDWSFTTSGTPLNNGYFITTTALSGKVSLGDTFTDNNNPGTVFTVTNIGVPFAGFVNVSFSPPAGSIMSNPDVVSFTGIPVSPGQSVALAAWLACSVPYAAGVTIHLRFRNAAGAAIADILAPPVSTVAPQLTAAAATAPPGSAYVTAEIRANQTPPAGTVFSAAGTATDAGYLSLPPGYQGWTAANNATITAVAAWGYDRNGPPNPTPWYIPFSGFFEKVPVTWDENFRGVAPTTVTDLWFSLQENQQPALLAEMLNDGPYALWPCTDPAGATQLGATNAAPGNGLPLTVSTASLGAGGSSAVFGGNSNLIAGAGSTLLLNNLFRIGASSGMWTVTSGGVAGKGISLACTDSNFPPIAAGVTVECWFQVQANALSNATVMSVVGAGGRGFTVTTDQTPANAGTGRLLLDTSGTNLPGTSVLIGSVVVNPNTPPGPLAHVMITFNRTTWAAYVNGNAAGTGSWATQLPKRFSYVAFNAVEGTPLDQQSNGSFGFLLRTNFTGPLGFAAVYPSQLSRHRALNHYQAGALAMAGESPSNRLERILVNSGDAALRRHIQADTGTWLAPLVSMQDTPQQPVSTALGNVASSLFPAVLAVAPTGDLFYLARQNAYNQAIRWTLGENLPAGETPVLPMPVYGSDPTKIVNQISLTQLDKQSGTAPQVPQIEQASQGQVGTITYFETGYLQGDSQSPLNAGPGLLDLANWLACTFAVPRERVESLTVDAAAHPAAWPLVLGAAPGDMAVSNRRWSAGGTGQPQISVTGRIAQTTRSFSFGYGKQVTGRLDILLDPAPENQILTTGDPVRGLLNGQNILAW